MRKNIHKDQSAQDVEQILDGVRQIMEEKPEKKHTGFKKYAKRGLALFLVAATIATTSNFNVNLFRADADTEQTDGSEESTEAETTDATETDAEDTTASDTDAASTSFSDEDLTAAVRNGDYTIDPKTGSVTSASITYNDAQLEFGVDYTAQATLTDQQTSGSKTISTYDVTVTGTGSYTGSAVKSGVTAETESAASTSKKVKSTKKSSTQKVVRKTANVKRTITDAYIVFDGYETASVVASDKSRAVYIPYVKVSSSYDSYPLDYYIHCTFSDNSARDISVTDAYFTASWSPSISVSDISTALSSSSKPYETTLTLSLSETGADKYTISDSFTGSLTRKVDFINTADKEVTVYCDGTKLNNSNLSEPTVDNPAYNYYTVIPTSVYDPTYTGSELKPTLTVAWGGTTLTYSETAASGYYIRSGSSTDANVSDTDESKAYVDIVLGSEHGSQIIRVFYNIEPRDISGATVTLADDNNAKVTDTTYTYDGTAKEPAVATATVAVSDSSPLTLTSSDYDVSYSNNTDAATADSASAPTVTLKGKGNFTGTAITNFTINKASIIKLLTVNGTTVKSGDKGSIEYKGDKEIRYTGAEIPLNPSDFIIIDNDGTEISGDKVAKQFNIAYASGEDATTKGSEPNVVITATADCQNYDNGTDDKDSVPYSKLFKLVGNTLNSSGITYTLSWTPADGIKPITATFSGNGSTEYTGTYDSTLSVPVNYNSSGTVAVVPTITITRGSTTLYKGTTGVDTTDTSYKNEIKSVNYNSNTSAGTAQIVITANDTSDVGSETSTKADNYAGSVITIHFNIAPLTLQSDGTKDTYGNTWNVDASGITVSKTLNSDSYTYQLVSDQKNSTSYDYSKTVNYSTGVITYNATEGTTGNFTGTATAQQGKNAAEATKLVLIDPITKRAVGYYSSNGKNKTDIMPYYGTNIVPVGHVYAIKKGSNVINFDKLINTDEAKDGKSTDAGTINLNDYEDVSNDFDITECTQYEPSKSPQTITATAKGGDYYGSPESAKYTVYSTGIDVINNHGKSIVQIDVDGTKIDAGNTIEIQDDGSGTYNLAKHITLWYKPENSNEAGSDSDADQQIKATVTCNGADSITPSVNPQTITLTPTDSTHFSNSVTITIKFSKINIRSSYFYIGTSTETSSALNSSYAGLVQGSKNQDGVTKVTLSGNYVSSATIMKTLSSYDINLYDTRTGSVEPLNNTVSENGSGYYIQCKKGSTLITSDTDWLRTAGTYTMEFHGIGDYSGTRTITFSVVSDNALTASFANTTIQYSGISDSFKNEITVRDANGKPLTNTDSNEYYTVTNSSNYDTNDTASLQKIGPHTALIRGKQNTYYEGATTTATYNVVGYLSDLDKTDLYKVTIGSHELTADEITKGITLYLNSSGQLSDSDGTISISSGSSVANNLNVSVLYGTDTSQLTQNTDYTVTESNLTQTGTGSITITGAGDNYRGSKTITVNILPSVSSGVSWASPDSGSTTQKTVDYISSGYTLDQSDLAVAVGSSTLSSSEYSVSAISWKNAAGSTKTYSSPSTSEVLTDVGDYTITIKDEAGKTSDLTLKIRYNLNNAVITLKNGGNDVTYDSTSKMSEGEVTGLTVGGTDIVTTKQSESGYKPQTITSGTSTYDYGIFKVTYTELANNGTSDNTCSSIGTVSVTVSADDKAEYSVSGSSKTVTFKIVSEQDKDSHVTITPPSDLVYNGKDQASDVISRTKVEYTVNNNTTDVSKKYDITIDGSTCTDAGTYTLRVSGNSDSIYSGSVSSTTFTIDPIDISTAKSTDFEASAVVYSIGGTAVYPTSLKYTGGSTTLNMTAGTDYTYDSKPTESDGFEPGSEVTVKINGQGNYKNSNTITYTIKKIDLSKLPTGASFTVSPSSYIYDRQAHIPSSISITVPSAGTTASNTFDITDNAFDGVAIAYHKSSSSTVISSSNVIDEGTYYLNLTASSSSKYFTGSLNNAASYTIGTKPLSEVISVSNFGSSDLAVAYGTTMSANTGSVSAPFDQVSTTYGTLKAGTDYNVSFRKDGSTTDIYTASDSGKYVAVLTARSDSNYSGSAEIPFTIGTDISGAKITTRSDIKYTGKSIDAKDAVSSVKYKGKPLTEGTDYTTPYYNPSTQDTVSAGNPITVAVDGEGAYYGTATATYTILKTTKQVIIKYDDNTSTFEYKGVKVEPGFSLYVVDNGNETYLDPATDYTYTITNDLDAGTGTINVTLTQKAVQNYSYEDPVGPFTFYISTQSIADSNFTVTYADGTTSKREKYTGSAVTEDVKVAYTDSDGASHTLGSDYYTVTYDENVKAGVHTVTVTGKNGYSGSQTLDLTIYASLTDSTTTITIPDQEPTGDKPTTLKGLVVNAGGNDLTLGTDYTLTIDLPSGVADWASATKAVATFTPNGSVYEDTATKTFNLAFSSSSFTVTGLASQYVYTGDAIKKVPTLVKDSNGDAVPISASSITYSNTSDGAACIRTGTVSVSIPVTLNNHTYTIQKQYTIAPKQIASSVVDQITAQQYDGTAKTPSVSITSSEGKALTANTDYYTSYSNNTAPGDATVTITGTGNYTGTITKHFDILLDDVSDVSATAADANELTVSWDAADSVDGYRITYQTGTSRQSQVTVDGASTTSQRLTGLKTGKTYLIQVQSYASAGKGNYSYGNVVSVSAATKPKATRIKSIKNVSGTKQKITWKKVSGASGYVIYRKAGSGKYKVVKTIKKGSTTSWITGTLTKGTKYTYRVLAYRLAGTKRAFANFSSAKSKTR